MSAIANVAKLNVATEARKPKMLPCDAPLPKWSFSDTQEPLPHGLNKNYTHIRIGTHPTFPKNQIFVIDLKAFPDSFFNVHQPGVRKHYQDMVSKPTDALTGDFHHRCMRYADARHTTFPHFPLNDRLQFGQFATIVNKSLEIMAGKPRGDPNTSVNRRSQANPVDFSQENNPAGFLATLRQHVQPPHTDTLRTAIDKYRDYARQNGLPESVVPWCMIMSLTKDTRMIFVHGVHGHPTFCQSPLLCDAPWKSVLMFR